MVNQHFENRVVFIVFIFNEISFNIHLAYNVAFWGSGNPHENDLSVGWEEVKVSTIWGPCYKVDCRWVPNQSFGDCKPSILCTLTIGNQP